MKKFTIIALLALTACDNAEPNSRQREAQAQEQMAAQAFASVGMPAITNFQEKRMMKMILELRDKALATTTYTQDMNGGLHKLCDSIGYGLPYATQYTNPQMIAYRGSQVGVAVLPQVDPNGLFSPPSADGTWVLCVNPKTKKPEPLYVEPHVIVSPFELPSK